MKIRKTLLSLALSGAMVLGMMPGMTMTALADEATTSYTLTIPSSLTVANSGWNATSGISATGTLESGKKLTVTSTSDDEFALVNQSDSSKKVGYKLATASTDTTATTTWEFTELSSTATTKTLGIIVDDYSSATPGTYTDTVTFTASVESAADFTLGGQPIKSGSKLQYVFDKVGDNTVWATWNGTSFSCGNSGWYGDAGARASVDGKKITLAVSDDWNNMGFEGFTVVFDTENDTYTVTSGSYVSVSDVKSVTVDGVEVKDKLTKQ